MAYLDVLPLATAKEYLRVDADLTDDDTHIERMISTAFQTIERITNVLVYARDKEYVFNDYFVRVYDYPINSIESPLNVTKDRKTNYTNYIAGSSNDEVLVLNVGYVNAIDVPDKFIDLALQYIKYLYYEAETNKANRGMLPQWLLDMLNQEKRFIL